MVNVTSAPSTTLEQVILQHDVEQFLYK